MKKILINILYIVLILCLLKFLLMPINSFMYESGPELKPESSKDFLTNIKDINHQGRSFLREEVTISGTVTFAANILGWRYYIISDSTGSITVIPSSKILPKEGTQKIVQGLVYQKSYLWGRETFGIKEKEIDFARE